jgi:hypothetical protein
MNRIKKGLPIPKNKVIEGVPVYRKEPTPEEKEAKGRKIDRWLKIAGIALTIFGGITFAEFVYEEMLQQIGMSCFVLRSVGTAEEIRECGAHLREEGENVKGVVETLGKINPLTYFAFSKFADSTILQGRAYEKLGEYKDPNIPKASLPYDSEDEKRDYERSSTWMGKGPDDLCNGTTCHLLKGWGE